MAVWRMNVLENQAVMGRKLATEMGIEWWGRQLEVAIGIGWLPQIRKTWPALGHQQSLEPQKWPRPKMGGEKRK
jgi:hypothetical protein